MIFLAIKRHVIRLSLTMLGLSISCTAMAINAYILTPDADSGNAMVSTLNASGINAQLGVSHSLWDGSQINLDDIDVVILNSRIEPTPTTMPLTGQQALLDFIDNGGGLITTAETYARMRSPINDYTLLSPALPFNPSGFIGGPGAVYSINTSNTVLNQDLSNFVFFNFDISPETSTLDIELYYPKKGATEYYSHNTSLTPRPSGLVGWQYNKGRVLSFANRFWPKELESESLATLLRNSVTWASGDSADDEICFPIKGSKGFGVACL